MINCQHVIWGNHEEPKECDKEATSFFASKTFIAVCARCEEHKYSVNLFNVISKEEFETFLVLKS